MTMCIYVKHLHPEDERLGPYSDGLYRIIFYLNMNRMLALSFHKHPLFGGGGFHFDMGPIYSVNNPWESGNILEGFGYLEAISSEINVVIQSNKHTSLNLYTSI